MTDLCTIYDQGEGDYDDADYHGWDEVAPNIHALIVDHEKTFEDLLRCVKVYPVAMGDMFIVLHILWSCMIVTNCGPSFGLK